MLTVSGVREHVILLHMLSVSSVPDSTMHYVICTYVVI